jgi:hypothetical protein
MDKKTASAITLTLLLTSMLTLAFNCQSTHMHSSNTEPTTISESFQLETYLQGYTPNKIILYDLLDHAENATWWNTDPAWDWNTPFGNDLGEHGAAKYEYNVTLEDGKTYPRVVLVRPNNTTEGRMVAHWYDVTLASQIPLFLKVEFGFAPDADPKGEMSSWVYVFREELLPEPGGDRCKDTYYSGGLKTILVDLTPYAGQTLDMGFATMKVGNNTLLNDLYLTKAYILTPKSDEWNINVSKEWLDYPNAFDIEHDLDLMHLLLLTVSGCGAAPEHYLGQKFGTPEGNILYEGFIRTRHIEGIKYIAQQGAFKAFRLEELLDKYPGLINASGVDSWGNPIYWIGCKFMSINHPSWQAYLKDAIKLAIDSDADGFLIDEIRSNVDTFMPWIGNGRGCYDNCSIENFKAWLQERNLTQFWDDQGQLVVSSLDELTLAHIDYVHWGEHLYSTDGRKLFDLFRESTEDAVLKFWTETITEARAYAASQGKEFVFTANIPGDCTPEWEFEYDLVSLLDYITFEGDQATTENVENRWRGVYGYPYYSATNPCHIWNRGQLYVLYTDSSPLAKWKMAESYSAMGRGTLHFGLDGMWVGGEFIRSITNLSEVSKYSKFVLTNSIVYENLSRELKPGMITNAQPTTSIFTYVGNENERLLAHIVNQNFSEEMHDIVPQPPFSLEIEIPSGFNFTGKGVYLTSPDVDQAIELPYNISGNYLNVDIPEVYIYSVLIVTDPILFESSRTLHKANLLTRDAKLDDVYVSDIDETLRNALTAYNEGEYQEAKDLSLKVIDDVQSRISQRDCAWSAIIRHELMGFNVEEAKEAFYQGNYNLASDVAVTSVTPYKTVVGQGLNMSISVTVENQGNFTETFNVTAYANTTSVASQNVTLSSGTSTTLTFTWNTTGFAYGNYTISAYAMPVPDETDTADNAFAGGTIKVSCIGDIDGTYSTTMLDYQLVKNAIPSTPGGPKWNPNADINNNGAVNMLDFQLVKIHVGQHV